MVNGFAGRTCTIVTLWLLIALGLGFLVIQVEGWWGQDCSLSRQRCCCGGSVIPACRVMHLTATSQRPPADRSWTHALPYLDVCCHLLNPRSSNNLSIVTNPQPTPAVLEPTLFPHSFLRPSRPEPRPRTWNRTHTPPLKFLPPLLHVSSPCSPALSHPLCSLIRPGSPTTHPPHEKPLLPTQKSSEGGLAFQQQLQQPSPG